MTRPVLVTVLASAALALAFFIFFAGPVPSVISKPQGSAAGAPEVTREAVGEPQSEPGIGSGTNPDHRAQNQGGGGQNEATGNEVEEPAGSYFHAEEFQRLSEFVERTREQRKKWPPRIAVKGIYLSGAAAGSDEIFSRLLKLVEDTELNAMVIDVKDGTGKTTYLSQVDLVQQVGAQGNKIKDLRRRIRVLKEKGIYTIARLVVFKDPLLARNRPDLAVRRLTGGNWKDRTGAGWTNPYQRQVWEYNLAIAREAARMGFDEIQFDYVRFPSDGDLSQAWYPSQDQRSRADVIAEYLAYARQELHKEGVYVSADVFGLVCSAEDDLGIGQVLEKVAPHVDFISPMVYPSHYAPRSYGLSDPDAMPYQTVLKSMQDATKRLQAMGSNAVLRPWLQDFSLRHRYGRSEVLAQILAVEEAGWNQWLLWNANSNFTFDGIPWH